MTHDETRDELARMDGWTRICGVPGMLKEDGDLHLKWKLRHHEQWDHPHPPTLDGANAAVPECFKWRRFSDCWVATHDDCETVVEVPVTGETPEHKMDDLYALALRCRRAMEEKR